MRAAWMRFRQGVSRDVLRVRRAFNFPSPQSQQLKRILAGVMSAPAVLWIVWAVVEDTETPQTPLPENILYYALSTIAQCAAALAALIGFLGLWRLDRLKEAGYQCMLTLYRVIGGRDSLPSDEIILRNATDLIKSWENLTSEQQASMPHEGAQARRTQEELARRESLRKEQQRLIRALCIFLAVTLTILILAIIGVPFVGALCTWPWTVTILIVLASLSLGIGPAYVVREAARSVRTLAVLALLLSLASPALAGPVRCTTYEEKTLRRLQTLCSDGTRAVSTWSPTLQRWDTTVTPPPTSYGNTKKWPPQPQAPRH
jgi:hypothetical protein